MNREEMIKKAVESYEKVLGKLDDKQLQNVAGAGPMELCPLCFRQIPDENMDKHLYCSHGFGENPDSEPDSDPSFSTSSRPSSSTNSGRQSQDFAKKS